MKAEDRKEPLLELDCVGVSFGGVRAVENVSLVLHEQEVLGLIGPNGAGKTSVFNCITGFYRANSGHVRLRGMDITHKRAYEISRMGVRRTFQTIRLFDDLTVYENILSGAHTVRAAPQRVEDQVHELCRLLGIDAQYLPRRSGDLPYGLQRRVELARALIADPCVLLLDEPGAGLNGEEKRAIVKLVRQEAIHRKMGVLLIEHDMGMIAEACDRVIVLDHGETISMGPPEAIKTDPAVIAAYLGAEESHA